MSSWTVKLDMGVHADNTQPTYEEALRAVREFFNDHSGAPLVRINLRRGFGEMANEVNLEVEVLAVQIEQGVALPE